MTEQVSVTASQSGSLGDPLELGRARATCSLRIPRRNAVPTLDQELGPPDREVTKVCCLEPLSLS